MVNLNRIKASAFSALDSNAASRSILWALYNYKNRGFMVKPEASDSVLRAVQRRGYFIIENFWTAAQCAEAADEIRKLFAARPEVVQRPKGEQTDSRIYGVEKLSQIVSQFSHHPMLDGFIANYTSYPSGLIHTLANIVDRPAYFGSGGRWHRDGFVPQLKTLMYLTDVTEDNGPFQVIADSHAWGEHFERDHRRYRLRFRENRVGSKADALKAREPDRVISVLGPAGTMVVFDTSAIHTGAPLKTGERIALTNYYTGTAEIGRPLYDLYSPVVMSHDSYLSEGQVRSFG